MRFLNTLFICLAFIFKSYSLETENSPQIYYPSFCHQLSAISCLGDSLEMEDGSVWSVNPADSKKIFLWSTLDPLVISPVKNLFSYYSYKIQNLATNEFIEVDLKLSPVIDSEYSHQILSIDFISCEVILSDNSVWNFNVNDAYKYKKWAIGDLIIIGMNEKSFLYSEEFILVNANMNNYCTVNAL
jgi:hypothetical protein